MFGNVRSPVPKVIGVRSRGSSKEALTRASQAVVDVLRGSGVVQLVLNPQIGIGKGMGRRQAAG